MTETNAVIELRTALYMLLNATAHIAGITEECQLAIDILEATTTVEKAKCPVCAARTR